MGSIGFDTRTPIIGHLVIQNLPTSVCPWTGTDGSWRFLSSPFSEPQGSACRKITMIFRLCLGRFRSSFERPDGQCRTGKKAAFSMVLAIWMVAGADATQALGPPAGGFLLVRKPVLSDLCRVPTLQCSFQFTFCAAQELSSFPFLVKDYPALELCVAGAESISERKGRASLFPCSSLMILK